MNKEVIKGILICVGFAIFLISFWYCIENLPEYKCVSSHIEEYEEQECERGFDWDYTCKTKQIKEEVCDKYKKIESKIK